MRSSTAQSTLDALMAEKPDPAKLPPDSLAAIAYATAHMGDYKLKTSAE